MSFWRRWRGKPDPEPTAALDAVASNAEGPPPDPDVAALDALAASAEAPDVEAALAPFESLVSRGEVLRAIGLGRRVLAAHAGLGALALRVAGELAGRGDDAGAAAVLAPALDDPGAPDDALLLGGELAERAGDRDRARGLYERLLARDVDHPQARPRAARLREGKARPADGATLLVDGALARGRWRIERELGRGGAGTVFAARDVTLDRVVALKLYHGRSRVERERLVVEARTAASLEHPGVIRILDLDESLGAIAMELLGGGSIRGAMRAGALDVARVRRLFESALLSLAYVHGHGVVHRDVKPSNLLVRDDDTVVLTDFGIALPAGAAPRPGAGGEGTLGYMPPEQRAGAAADPAMDVYALGVTLREMLGAARGEPDAALLDVARACTHDDVIARPTIAALSVERPVHSGR